MKVNWKIRFKNGPWLASFISMIVSFVYALLDSLGVIPAITQDNVLKLVNLLLLIASSIGVITDPTQAKVLTDSERAMKYEEPWEDIETDADD